MESFIRLTKRVFRQTMILLCILKWKVSIKELSFVDRINVRVGDDRQSDNWKSSDGPTINNYFNDMHGSMDSIIVFRLNHWLYGCRLPMAWNVPYLPTHPHPLNCQSLVGFRNLMMAFKKKLCCFRSSREYFTHECVTIFGEGLLI